MSNVTLRIILNRPPAGVDYALQEVRVDLSTVQKQRSKGSELEFDLTANAKQGKDDQPNFTGPFVQGRPASDSFTSTSALTPVRPIRVGVAV